MTPFFSPYKFAGDDDGVDDLTPYQRGRYDTMRKAGESHKLALVLASGKFPGVRTDSTFNIGRVNGSQFEHCPAMGDYYRGVAESHGVNVTGKYYMHQLANFPGDPKAWVADRGDVARVCRERGWGASGAGLEIAGQVVDSGVPERFVADDIVAREVDRQMGLDGGERRADVAERVRQELSGENDPHPLRVQEVPHDAPRLLDE